jgi:N-acetylglucosaminyldiphosphoundecaprenol N-acetyl-beta-D-mannosaminyltransferase
MTSKLFGVPISITSKSQALALIGEWVIARRAIMTNDKFRILNEKNRNRHSSFSIHNSEFPKIITTPNPEMIVAAQSDPEFLAALRSADLSIPDGIGIVWALKILQGRRTKYEGRRQYGSVSSRPSAFSLQPSALSRLSGLDLMESLIGESAKNGWKVMFLGGKPGVAEKASEKLLYQIRPGLAKQGQAFIRSIGGPRDIANISKLNNDRLISEINSFPPDLLFVAFGHGKQEKWLSANRHRLNVGVAMGVGGALDQIADPSLRPPAYINSIGLGWLYRLVRQPWRIKRQLALLKFIWMMIKLKTQISKIKA